MKERTAAEAVDDLRVALCDKLDSIERGRRSSERAQSLRHVALLVVALLGLAVLAAALGGG